MMSGYVIGMEPADANEFADADDEGAALYAPSTVRHKPLRCGARERDG
jgi:hypothetical protein